MSWLEALVLGIVQGLTEFLPVSSSGHLQIFKEILGVEITRNLTFEIVVHAATVCSTLVVLRKEIARLLQGFFKFRMNEETEYVLKILVSMIPVAVVGFCFKKQVEAVFGEGLGVVGACLLVTACLLAFAYYAKPRSGSTIATGILLGNNKENVAKFSFLMVLVPILGEALLEVKDMFTEADGANVVVSFVPLLIGFCAAFISGFLACQWMLNLVRKGKLIWFAVYCLVVGTVVLIYHFL